ncbi:MAG: Crp/Fnr family transcriptional regulator [Mycobacteriales bacterium]
MAGDAERASRGVPAGRADQVTDLLRRVPLLAVLGQVGLGAAVRAGSTRTYPAGQIICHQGDPGDRLYIVLHGLVKVVFTSERGDEIVLRTLGDAEVFGELALLDKSPRSASVVAVESTQVFMLLRERLLELMRQHPRLADEFLRMLGQLVRRLTEQAGDLVFLDLPGRLAKLLLQLVERHGPAGGTVLDRRLTQSDLAAMIGASRPAVNRALQSLAARGFLTLQGQAIVLRDVEGLRRRAEM